MKKALFISVPLIIIIIVFLYFDRKEPKITNVNKTKGKAEFNINGKRFSFESNINKSNNFDLGKINILQNASVKYSDNAGYDIIVYDVFGKILLTYQIGFLSI